MLLTGEQVRDNISLAVRNCKIKQTNIPRPNIVSETFYGARAKKRTIPDRTENGCYPLKYKIIKYKNGMNQP